jgi:hypothetical protein
MLKILSFHGGDDVDGDLCCDSVWTPSGYQHFGEHTASVFRAEQ